MKKIKFYVLFSFFTLFLGNLANAQIYFKNSSSVNVNVAIGFYLKGSDFEGWVTKGYFYAIPGQTVEVLDYMPAEVFYTINYTPPPDPEGGACTSCLLIDPKKNFLIANANNEEVNKGKGFVFSYFTQETVQSNNWQALTKTKHTIIYNGN